VKAWQVAAAKRLRPQRGIDVQVAGQQGRNGGGEKIIARTETTDLGKTAKGTLITGRERLHDVSGGGPQVWSKSTSVPSLSKRMASTGM
jgi:hypothetical protein